jgi:DNA/RNA endonuclease G (NUC1)
VRPTRPPERIARTRRVTAAGGNVAMRLCATIVLALGIGLWLNGPSKGQPDPTDPKSCSNIWSEVGLPESSSTNTEDNTSVCHDGYITGHNSRTKTPDWVIERLTSDLVKGSQPRPGVKFKADPALGEKPKAVPTDYEKSGYAIGHQAPSADFTSREQFMRDTFFLSNAVPQEGIGFNTGVWSGLERLVRTLAEQRSPLFVITGPVYQQRKAIQVTRKSDACRNEITLAPLDNQSICPAHNENANAKCEAGVAVPAALYKIIYDPGQGGRVNAYLLPNVNHIPLKHSEKTLEYLKRYQVAVSTVEELTGYQFLTALTRRKQLQLKESCGATMLH